MPIYEYRCQACKIEFEEFIRSSRQEDELTCPHCGSEEIQKGFSLFGMSGLVSERAIPATAANAGGCGPVG